MVEFNMEDEVFKVVEGFPDYQVSNLGRVLSTKGGGVRVLLPDVSNGYCRARMYDPVKKKSTARYIHRLVAKAFLSNPRNLPFVNHIDEDKLNNRLENLEWVSEEENRGNNNLLQRMSNGVVSVCMESGRETFYSSLQEAARQTGYSRTSIWRCCIGRFESFKGHYWIYDDIYDAKRLIFKCQNTITQWRGSKERLLDVISSLLSRVK